jgi:uncharacterized membrane protein
MARLTDQELTARNRRNMWMALALVGFIVVIFMTTFLRMQHNSRMAREAVLAQSAPVSLQAGERPGTFR